MHKSLILGARMRNKADKVVELEESIKELNKRSELEAKKLEKAGNDEEVSAVEKSLEEIQKELDEKLAEKEQLEKEIEDLRKKKVKVNGFGFTGKLLADILEEDLMENAA